MSKLIESVEAMKNPDYLPPEYRLVFNGAIDEVLNVIRAHEPPQEPATTARGDELTLAILCSMRPDVGRHVFSDFVAGKGNTPYLHVSPDEFRKLAAWNASLPCRATPEKQIIGKITERYRLATDHLYLQALLDVRSDVQDVFAKAESQLNGGSHGDQD